MLSYSTFSGLDLGRGSQGQRTVKRLDSIFSHTFQLIRMKFAILLKQVEHEVCYFVEAS